MAKHSCISSLRDLGISYEDATALRRISMTLHSWHELECGNSNEYSSYVITRGFKKDGVFVYDDNGKAYMERHYHRENKARYALIPDRERGAQKRLGKIMARYPELIAYIQPDCRGTALYILRRSDIPDGVTVDSCYSSRGIAVYK